MRQAAVCRGCGQEKEGVTRFETMAYGGCPAGRAIHFCDYCDRRIVERPLEVVIQELFGG